MVGDWGIISGMVGVFSIFWRVLPERIGPGVLGTHVLRSMAPSTSVDDETFFPTTGFPSKD